jgi:hypothetical protein
MIRPHCIEEHVLAGGDLVDIQGTRRRLSVNRQPTSNAEDGPNRPSPSGRSGTRPVRGVAPWSQIPDLLPRGFFFRSRSQFTLYSG